MMYIVKCSNKFYWFILGIATDELCLQDWMTGGWGFRGAMGYATVAPAVHADMAAPWKMTILGNWWVVTV